MLKQFFSAPGSLQHRLFVCVQLYQRCSRLLRGDRCLDRLLPQDHMYRILGRVDPARERTNKLVRQSLVSFFFTVYDRNSFFLPTATESAKQKELQ